MTLTDEATRFAELHVKGTPLLLYNAWDAGSAKAIVEAGAKAIGTSSWAVAGAQGYRDGEDLPLPLAEQIVGRIAASISVPLTVDFEGGYSDDDRTLAENVARLLDLGVAGINFEDRVVKGAGLYPIKRQAQRLHVLRRTAEQQGTQLFINARTDLFLGQGRDPAEAVSEAFERAAAYAAAGASGLFVPGLKDESLIGRICDRVSLPVNVMLMEGVPPARRLAELGVARISYGPLSYIRATEAVKQEARWAHSSLDDRPRHRGEGPEPVAGWWFDK